jgi:hypothetical protein
LNEPFELPSLQEIEEMERQRSQAIESLQISNDNGFVKCQQCDIVVPIVRKMTKSSFDRIAVLRKRISWLENYATGNKNSIIRSNLAVNIKQLKQELAELQEEDAEYDKLRNLPLYSCKITGWKFVCSKCYDKIYNNCMLVQRP